MQQSKLMLRCNMYISFAALHKFFGQRNYRV